MWYCTKRFSKGVTPINIACYRGHVAAVETLVALGCDVNEISRDGANLLYTAAIRGHAKVVGSFSSKLRKLG
jgi:ankyrin repeat protein